MRSVALFCVVLSVQLVGGPPAVLPEAAAARLAQSLNHARSHTDHVWRDTGALNADGTLNAYVEIARGDQRKWEYDMQRNERAMDRVLPRGVGGYPVNYGFVPQTISYDGDPLDVLVLGPSIPGGRLVRGVIVGLMHMEDEKGLDSKVVISRVGPHGRAMDRLTSADRSRIGDYFERYKLHESGKFSSVGGWGTRAQGLAFVESSHRFFRECRDVLRGPCRLIGNQPYIR